MIQSFLSFIRKLALSFWLGEMLFFIIVFAPRVFKILEKPIAAQLQASIFPAYYLVGVICAGVILLSLLIDLPRRRFQVAFALTVFAGCVFAYSLWHITPEIVKLQNTLYASSPDPTLLSEARSKFDELHQQSVQLNGAALLALLVLLVLI